MISKADGAEGRTMSRVLKTSRSWTTAIARRCLCLSLPFVALSFAAVSIRAESPGGSQVNVTIPKSVEGWILSGPGKRVEPETIFDYMDGAGELYLGYRFKHLDVYKFEKPGSDEILVELYWMGTSDDAWGLLSGDWGGERVDLTLLSGSAKPNKTCALYGRGLLRLWSGNLYARILAYTETDASRQAVLAIGRTIVAGRPETDAPRLAQVLPRGVGMQFLLRMDRVVFLRSHLVLNSVYFLSQENLLDLGSQCELVAATYRMVKEQHSTKPVRVLLVRYADEDAARKALVHFQRVYLAGKAISQDNHGTMAIEDGWLGFILSGRGLGLVFEAPDEASTHLFLENSKQALESMEVSHE